MFSLCKQRSTCAWKSRHQSYDYQPDLPGTNLSNQYLYFAPSLFLSVVCTMILFTFCFVDCFRFLQLTFCKWIAGAGGLRFDRKALAAAEILLSYERLTQKPYILKFIWAYNLYEYIIYAIFYSYLLITISFIPLLWLLIFRSLAYLFPFEIPFEGLYFPFGLRGMLSFCKPFHIYCYVYYV